MYEIPDDYQPLQKADTEHLVRASKGPSRKEDCEVRMYIRSSVYVCMYVCVCMCIIILL